MIKNILFDFGGVMITVSQWPVRYIEKKYDITVWDIMSKIKFIIIKFAQWEIRIDEFKLSLLDVLGKEIWWALFDRWGHRSNAVLNTEIVEFVENLKNKWFRCCLLSDTNEIHKNSNELKWRYDVFDLKNRILSCDIWVSKVADWANKTTKFFDYALGKLNIQANESIFIDDLQVNCDVANKVWIQAVLANTPKQVVQDLSGILGLD